MRWKMWLSSYSDMRTSCLGSSSHMLDLLLYVPQYMLPSTCTNKLIQKLRNGRLNTKQTSPMLSMHH